MESERDDKLEGTCSVLRGGRGELARLLDTQDWTEDVRYDVVQKEALVGDEQSDKGHQVRVDAWVNQYLHGNKGLLNLSIIIINVILTFEICVSDT